MSETIDRYYILHFYCKFWNYFGVITQIFFLGVFLLIKFVSVVWSSYWMSFRWPCINTIRRYMRSQHRFISKDEPEKMSNNMLRLLEVGIIFRSLASFREYADSSNNIELWNAFEQWTTTIEYYGGDDNHILLSATVNSFSYIESYLMDGLRSMIKLKKCSFAYIGDRDAVLDYIWWLGCCASSVSFRWTFGEKEKKQCPCLIGSELSEFGMRTQVCTKVVWLLNWHHGVAPGNVIQNMSEGL